MSPEEQAQLRYLMRKGKELPMPLSALLSRVSRRFGTGAERGPSIQQQAGLVREGEIREEKETKKKESKEKQELEDKLYKASKESAQLDFQEEIEKKKAFAKKITNKEGKAKALEGIKKLQREQSQLFKKGDIEHKKYLKKLAKEGDKK